MDNTVTKKSPFKTSLFLDIAASETGQAWFVVLIASLFFFYEFIQLNMFDTISFSLMQTFKISAVELGRLSAFYLLANVMFLIPAGMILDRVTTRTVILIALAICILGTLGLSLSTSVWSAALFRFLTGIGSAFCFLSTIRLASRWFPKQQLALVVGVIVTIAMTGGMVGQAPMMYLVQDFGWRHALLFDSGLGLIIFLLIYIVVEDYPKSQKVSYQHEQHIIQTLGYWKSLRLAFLQMQNWLGGLYTLLMNLPIGLLGGLWGGIYLVCAHHLTKMEASTVSSMLFLGTIFGSPVVGWISDKIGLRRMPMMIGAVLALLLVGILLFFPQLSFYDLLLIFFLMGLVTSSQILAYPLVAESNPRILTAMSSSVISISVQGGVALFQPIFGFLLDHHMMMRNHMLTEHFIAADFRGAVLLFPIGFLLAFLITILIRETYCQERH